MPDPSPRQRPVRFAVALLIAASLPRVAWAQPQTGGMPAMDDRVTVLEGTVTNLQTTVTSLQTANTNLQNALAAEIAARIAGDVQEAASRIGADLLLQGSISNEANTRASADQALSNLINARPKAFVVSIPIADVPNGDETIVATLTLPAGKFFATAKGTASNREHDVVWGCTLERGSDNAVFDSVITSTETVGATGWISNNALALAGVVTLTAPGTVVMKCRSGEGGSSVDHINLIAIEVGS